MTTDRTNSNNQRFSLISCVTEDSIDSSNIATPLDASPPPPPSNRFSIINIVNDDPFPNTRAYPAIASTLTTAASKNRRRAQTSPRPVPSSIFTTVVPQQPTMIYDSSPPVTPLVDLVTTTSETTKSDNKFWPKIKRIMLSSSTSKAFESRKNLSTQEEEEKTTTQKNMRWLTSGRNRTRVSPQR